MAGRRRVARSPRFRRSLRPSSELSFREVGRQVKDHSDRSRDRVEENERDSRQDIGRSARGERDCRGGKGYR